MTSVSKNVLIYKLGDTANKSINTYNFSWKNEIKIVSIKNTIFFRQRVSIIHELFQVKWLVQI